MDVFFIFIVYLFDYSNFLLHDTCEELKQIVELGL